MTSISAYSGSSAWATTSSDRSSRMQQRMFAKVDSNGDGSVDKTELQTMLSKIAEKDGSTALNADDVFSKMDSDGSGSLSASELDAGMKSLMPPPSSTVDFAQQRGVDGPPPGPPPGMDGDTMKLMQDVFKAADTDGDGTLSTSEKDKLTTQIESALGGSDGTGASTDTSTSSTSASSAPHGPDILAALLEKVLKQYAAGATDTTSQANAVSSISTTA